MTIASMSVVTRVRAASTNGRCTATALIELNGTCSSLLWSAFVSPGLCSLDRSRSAATFHSQPQSLLL